MCAVDDGYASGYDAERWHASRRISLAESANCADAKALAEARNHRLQGIWQETAVELAESGTDLRPLLANLPGLATAAAAGRSLRTKAKALRDGGAENFTLAASYLMQAARLLSRARFEQEAELAESDAFVCIQDAVHDGAADHVELRRLPGNLNACTYRPRRESISAGGWSDTPPFCFDWGGTVLNCALEINGAFPIETEIRRIDEPVIRCYADGQG